MITEKITSDQEAQINKFFADMLRKMKPSFSKDEAQEIIKTFNVVKLDIEKVLKTHAISDKRFGLTVIEFTITVPNDYKHENQINTFAKKVKKLETTNYYNDDFTDENFTKATNKLEPGKTYIVKIHPILQTVQSEDCMLFLKKQNSILVGGQGISLIYELNKEAFPKGKYTVSFDEKDALWVDSDGRHRVPNVIAYSDGDFSFRLGGFEDGWRDNYCLLSVCEIPSDSQTL